MKGKIECSVHYRVLCADAACSAKISGNGPATAVLRKRGWRYIAKRGGWLCPKCNGEREKNARALYRAGVAMDRLILSLRESQHLTWKEVARRVNRSVGTVRTRYYLRCHKKCCICQKHLYRWTAYYADYRPFCAECWKKEQQ